MTTLILYLIAAFTMPRIAILCMGRVWRWRRKMFLAAMIVIVAAALLPKYGITVQLVAFLFIPCVVKDVNRPAYFWIRQVVFASGAISSIL